MFTTYVVNRERLFPVAAAFAIIQKQNQTNYRVAVCSGYQPRTGKTS